MNSFWKCPLSGRTDCAELHAVSTDGGLRHTSGTILMEMSKQGWQKVDYPKRSYYYEYDKSHPSYREKEQIGMKETAEYLEVDVL